MKYDHPDLQHRLAAEYVLGTLQGPARRRFERLLADDAALRRRVAAWETRLTPWVAGTTPVPVPPAVWQGVRQRLGFVPAPARAGAWRWWAFGSTALAVSLALLLVLRPATVAPPAIWQDMAVLSDEQKAVWIVRASGDGGVLQFSGLSSVEVPAGHDIELWAVPAEGAPLSLGVIHRQGSRAAEVVVSAEGRARLARGVALAVSLEPVGGSPTGAPTGPVLWSGKLQG
jgi:anti-sigma-K factor RskA